MAVERYTLKLNRPKLGVGLKTMAAQTVAFWVPVLIIVGVLFYQFNSLMYAENLETVKTHLKGAKGVFGERTLVLERLAAQISSRPDVREAFLKKDSAALQTLLLEFGVSNSFVDLWMAVDESQKVIGRRHNKTGDIVRIGDALSRGLTTGQVVSSTEIVTKEMIALEEEEVAKRVKNVGLVQFVISPVRDGEKVIGAIVTGMLLSGDPWIGNAVHNRFGVEMAVFAGESPESLFVHTTASLPRQTWMIGQPIPHGLKENMSLGKPYYGTLDVGDSSHIAAYEPLLDSRNGIIGAIGVSMQGKPIDAIVIKAISGGVAVAAFIGLVIAVSVAVFTYLDISRPLNLLSNAMDRLGADHSSVVVELKTGDEFEKLGEGFNTMARGIEKREDRLKKHYEVAKLLMSTIDLKELLDKMLKIVVDITESQIGVVYLVESDDMLVPRATCGMNSELVSIKVGEGMPGRVAAEKKTIVVMPPDDTDDSIELGYTKINPTEVAYIPLVYQSRVLGVLSLGSLNKYREEDRLLFEYLADQIAIALDNAIMHRKIEELSVTDPLTGLFNRRYLNAKMATVWARSVRHGCPLAVILADVDNFKQINDTYGHDRGDEVLSAVSEIIRSNVRVEDVTARFGGEEFVVALPDINGQQAYVFAERIRKALEEKKFDWMEGGVTLSLGIASFPEITPGKYEDLIQVADQAMYQAKVAGKNRVVLSAGAARG